MSRLDEAIQILKGLWASQPLTFTGNHYTVTKLNGFPKPVQQPHPPLLIGARSKRMLALAAREANIVGILPKALPSGTISEEITERLPSTMTQKVEWVREDAGERFHELELDMIIAPIFTEQRRRERYGFSYFFVADVSMEAFAPIVSRLASREG